MNKEYLTLGFPKIGVPFLGVPLRGFYSIRGRKRVVPLFSEMPIWSLRAIPCFADAAPSLQFLQEFWVHALSVSGVAGSLCSEMGVSEIRGCLSGVLMIRGSYYLGVYVRGPRVS